MPISQLSCHICEAKTTRQKVQKQGWKKREVPSIDHSGKLFKSVLWTCAECGKMDHNRVAHNAFEKAKEAAEKFGASGIYPFSCGCLQALLTTLVECCELGTYADWKRLNRELYK